ncbi:MAG: alanine--tRNA ligase-related protein, partial [Chloroflexota bacterium]|nr:alanine--tRNA ligase-related protein [Chloroflexota bacterium]
MRFERVPTSGLKYLSRLQPDEHGLISGSHLFTLHAEKGFPADLAAEVLADRGLEVDWSSYEPAAEEHRRVSRISAEQHFRSV